MPWSGSLLERGRRVTAALLVPEEGDPTGPEACDPANPADLVPSSETLRAWRGIVTDAARSVDPQVLQAYAPGRLEDAFEVSGVRVSTAATMLESSWVC